MDSSDLESLLQKIRPIDLRIESYRRKKFDFIVKHKGKHHKKQERALRILNDGVTEEFLYGGAAGGAKIVQNTGVVLTPHGWKKGIDLEVGDLLNNPDGSVQRIIAIKPEIFVDKWRVSFRDGTYTDVGKEHLWQAWKGGKGRKISNERVFGRASAEVIETSELKEWLDRGYNPQIPVCEPQNFNRVSREKNRIEPYLLGVLLGDGCLTAKQIMISSSNYDITHYVNNIGNINYSIGDGFIAFKGSTNKWLRSKILLHGLEGKKSINKFIPEVYKWGSVSDRLSIIQGLMDKDGTSAKDKNACSYTTISKRLADDVAFIIRSLGGVVTISKNKSGYKDGDGTYVSCNDSYRLYIKYRDPDNLFRMYRKKHGKFGRSLVQKCVSNVEVVGKIRGRCITVSNPNGLYITNDFIVTHNSWTGAVDLAFKCLLYPNSNWFIGRQELKRLTESTLKTFFKVCRTYGIEDYKYNAQRFFIRFGNGSNIDLLELKYKPSDPDYERYGSTEYTGGWIDEIAEVDFGAYDVLRTRIGRHMNDEYNVKAKIFATCNPTKAWAKRYFYDPAKKKEHPNYIKYVASLVTDNPFIDQGYVEKLKRTSDKTKRERLLEGNWDYDDSENALCKYEDILAIFSNNHIKASGNYYITADVARFGSDKAVLLVWDDWTVVDYVTFPKSSITELSDAILDLREKWGVPRYKCLADEDGVGGGLVDVAGIEGFVNNRSPIMVENSDDYFRPNYSNLQTQCAYFLVEKINLNKLYISCTMRSSDMEEVLEEFGQLQSYRVDDDRKLHILPKKEIKKNIGRSPDWRDAFLMRSYFDIANVGDTFIIGL